MGSDRRNPELAHNPKKQDRKRTCEMIRSVIRKQRHRATSAPYQVAQEADGRTGNHLAPPSLSPVLWPLDRSSHRSNSHRADAKTNSHVHSAHKTQKLSMGTDGHTGPNAFISIICCCGSEMIILQFSFILELPIQCLIESFETSEG